MNGSKAIMFHFTITSPSHVLSNKNRSDVSAILCVEATLTIWHDQQLFVRIEGLTILEFYKSLIEWIKLDHKNKLQAFTYFSIDHDESEGPILSLVPYNDKVSMQSIWSEQEQPLILKQKEVLEAFISLEQDLQKEIERTFTIDLKSFIKHIPYRIHESITD
ncbi:DUF7878 domain-containing protein [Alkalicoccobacillus gibsonii]|uniref:DUF7878 domain-containing protein n=1 Tax=Alkalicoccobacillus gibsonii TaxID=79881 RepID=UPI003513F23F